jgi:glyoxylase-like metal-dependent hydrolase (beta-lactamase superfamily II)
MSGWFRVGEIEACVVSDGVMRQDAGAVFGLVPRIMWERYAGELDDQYRMNLGLNSLLVRAEGKLILVDTGCGDKGSKAPGAVSTSESGRLIENLAAAGVRPSDIDVVVNTHLHFDHCGGNTTIVDEKLAPTFPNACYVTQAGEWDAATHPNERTRGTYLAENLEPVETAGQLELVRGEVELAKGVRIVPAPGHTEDHCAVELESEGEMAVYVGELAQHPVMLERLAWISSFDVLPLVSLETKRRMLDRAAEKQALLISVHAPYPGLGRLRADDGKRKWVEEKKERSG